MLEEESLHCRKNAAGATLVLEYRIVHFLIEVEALRPGRVEAWRSIPEEKRFDPGCLLRSQ